MNGYLKKWVPDKLYLKIKYKRKMGHALNLKNPQTFNEKLQWLKLHDRNPSYTMMVDKYEVKQYVAKKIGEQYVIPTYGVWDNFDDINFDLLPEQFVLKCTHDSGGLVICKDKKELDIEAAKRKINKCLKRNYYWVGREWPYKNVKPRIIAEKYLEDSGTGQLWDYKFFCFDGSVRCFKVDFDRFIEHHANYYDRDNNLLDFGEAAFPPKPEQSIQFPNSLDEMKAFAELLSQATPFLRADFYDADGKVYFGEITFYPASGFGRFTSDEWDSTLGKWICLPESFRAGCGGGYWIIIDDIVVVFTVKKSEIKDYKIWCFNGEPRFVLVCSNRFATEGLNEDFYDMQWKHTSFSRPHHKGSELRIKQPTSLVQMRHAAETLAKNIPFTRVDFYEVNGSPYFGEITFYPASGFESFEPSYWDERLGNMVKLNIKRGR